MSNLNDKQPDTRDAQDSQDAHDELGSQDTIKSRWGLPATYAFILSYILATTYAVFSIGFLLVLSFHIIVLFLCIVVVQAKFDELHNTIDQCIDVIENQVDFMCNMADSIKYIKYKVGIFSTDETEDDNKPT